MMRSIPAAGHSIGIGSVIRAWKRPRPAGLPDALLQVYPHALPTNSGTTALYVAMMALKDQSTARKVILPAYTCPSVAAAALRAGLTPVLCDLAPHRFVLDEDHLAGLIDDDTLAVVAVHLFGVPQDLEALRVLIAGRGVAIIEDASQATANRDPATGKPLGTQGDVGVLSFGRGKPLSVLSGGAVVCSGDAIRPAADEAWNRLAGSPGLLSAARHLVVLLAYTVLFHPRLFWIPRALPGFRVGETWFEQDFPSGRAGSGVIRMLGELWPRLESIRSGRERTARAFRSALSGCRGVRQPDLEAVECGLLRYPLVFPCGEQRDRALAAMEQEGLGGTGMYPAPLHSIPGLKERFPGVACRNAEALSERILTLPLHDRVEPDDVDRMAALVCEACAHG